MMKKQSPSSSITWHYYLAWIIAASALLGSLYFSEIKDLPPCVLCWYQRIFMYPIALILPIGIIRREGVVALYTLPLALIGAAIAFYHYLLQLKIIPESVAPCVQGLSCSEIQTEYFGFITIPFLSLAAFIIISVVLALTLKNESRK